MKISGLGEDRIVEAIAASFQKGRTIPLDIGDDCAAVLSGKRGWLQLLKTDAMVEGVHFLSDALPHQVGRKALARVVSDIAAMGGVPEYALLTVALPLSLTLEYVKALTDGIARLAQTYRIKVVGGETIRSPGPLFLSITLTGRVEAKKIVTRDKGKAGDLLYVTGVLGGTIRRHQFYFQPRLAEGQWLAAHCKPSAMMDISDGLALDLPRLATASKVGFVLNSKALPKRRGCSIASALQDGEDFELLFAIAPSQQAFLQKNWKRRFPKTRLTCIGQFTRKGTMDLGSGFDHFAP